jgi:hypothetical protein
MMHHISLRTYAVVVSSKLAASAQAGCCSEDIAPACYSTTMDQSVLLDIDSMLPATAAPLLLLTIAAVM